MDGLTLRGGKTSGILVLHEEGGHSNWSTSPAMRTNICLVVDLVDMRVERTSECECPYR